MWNEIKDYFKEFSPASNFRMLGSNLKGDIMGGITTGVVALPLALAFGVSSGLGAKAGLIGAIILGLLAALFGGTPSQVSGPTAPMTIIMAAVVMQHTGNPLVVFGVIVLAGVFQIIFGLTKIGKYIQYMPYPVVSGFMSGIGIIILITQLNPFMGLPTIGSVEAFFEALPYSFMNINWAAIAVGSITLLSIYVFPRIHRAIPSAIVAIILGTALAKALNLDLALIGDIPKGLPAFRPFPFDWQILKIMIAPAMTLAVIGLVDSLLTSLVADRLTKHKHESNRELIGQGLGNCVAGLFGGLPGAGATIRTEININTGGRTPLSGVSYSLLILASMVFLGQWLKEVPMACLAAVLFKAAIDIIHFKSLKQLVKIPFFDEVVLLVVFALTVSINIMVAVGIGLLLACILFVKRMGDLLAIDVINLNDIGKSWVADESWRSALTTEEKSKILVFQMNGPLFFGASSNFLKSAEKHGDFAGLILRMHRVPEIDTTGAYALEELAEMFGTEKKFLFITGLGEEPKAFLRKMKFMDILGEENFFLRFEQAALRAAEIVRARQGR
ncbi:MAG: SulP family inorganic anion transporter [Candidatus Omnitrophota bacterium]|nr:MAG: SulP family inorganic anion transporter [Candidatus Omnitrophota bacterium]